MYVLPPTEKSLLKVWLDTLGRAIRAYHKIFGKFARPCLVPIDFSIVDATVEASATMEIANDDP